MDPLEKLAQTSTLVIAEHNSEPLGELAQERGVGNAVGLTVDSKYEIHSLIGEGGMGSVYRARHIHLDKDVALKILKSSNLRPESWERFQREVRALAKLNNLNVIQVFDFGISKDNIPYYTMELLNGKSLAEHIQSNGLPLKDAIWIADKIASAMAVAHNAGIVHRDLKPANIFLVFNEEEPVGVKVLDFGIAKLSDSRFLDLQKLTSAGTIFGSPFYMSPEQADGREIDSRSDIYSFGCLFFEMLAGHPPFRGDNSVHTLHLHQTAAIPVLEPGMFDEGTLQKLDSLLQNLLAKDPQLRIQKFEDVSHLLIEICDGDSAANKKYSEKAIRRSSNHDVSSDVSRDPEGQPLVLNPSRYALLLIPLLAFSVVGVIWLALSLQKPSSQKTQTKTDQVESAANESFLQQLDEMPAQESNQKKSVSANSHKPYKWRKIGSADFDRIAQSAPPDLDLKYSTFENDELRKLARLNLRYLNLDFTNFDDLGAKALGKEITITSLRLHSTRITDKGLQSICQIPTIRYLDLRNTSITDAGLATISQLPKIKTLRIADTKVTAAGVESFCKNKTSVRDIELSTGPDLSEIDLRKLVKQFPLITFADKADLDRAGKSFVE